MRLTVAVAIEVGCDVVAGVLEVCCGGVSGFSMLETLKGCM